MLGFVLSLRIFVGVGNLTKTPQQGTPASIVNLSRIVFNPCSPSDSRTGS